jgi:hypothetical protein
MTEAQKLGHMESNRITLNDRFVAGLLSALMIAVMAIGTPIALLLLTRGRALEVFGVFGTFHTWGSAVVVLGWLAGFVLGSERSIVLFAHLWGTERPKNIRMTLSLWAALVGAAGINYWLFDQLHAF